MTSRNRFKVSKGALIVAHLTTGRSVQGVVLRRRRGAVELRKYQVEADGAYHDMRGERCIIPAELVEFVEVVR